MDTVLATLWKDIIVAAGLGAVGGFGLSLLQEKGLEMPHWYKETGVHFADLGFIADILIGALAAVIIYTLDQPNEMLQLLSVAITAAIVVCAYGLWSWNRWGYVGLLASFAAATILGFVGTLDWWDAVFNIASLIVLYYLMRDKTQDLYKIR